MRFDSEPFRIQCSQLQQCQNSRDVLIACSSTWTLLCAFLQDISDFHVHDHDLSLATLARQLVDSMFSVAKVLLRKRRLPKDVVACCNIWCCALFHWIWTPEGKWCRTAVSVQQVFGAVTMFRSLMWLHMHRFSNLALQFGRMMPQCLQGVFWGLPWNSAARHAAIDVFVDMQLAALCAPPSNFEQASAWLYCWWQRGFRYVGMARSRRANQASVGGPLCRYVEHISLRTRIHHRDAAKQRYRRACRYHGGSFWWLVSYTGSVEQVAAAEQLEIQLHRPNANYMKPISRSSSAAKPRRRPPLWLRQRRPGPGHAAWEGPVGSAVLGKKILVPFQNSTEPDMASWSFAMAYRFLLRCAMASTGQLIAINIYAPRFAQLLLLWAASGNKVDWDLVEKLWQVPCGPVALAQRLHLVQGPHRLRRLRQLLDSALRLRGLPSTHVSFIKVPVAEIVPVVRANAAAIFRRCLTPVEASWCMSRLRFLHGGAQTHSNSWTHARDAKALDWRNLLATPEHNIQSAISGFNMTYVNKNWDVPLLYKDRALEKAAHDCVVRAVAKVRSIPAHKIHTKKVLAHPALIGYCNQRKQRWSAYVVHTKDMSRQGGVSIVPDDKNKKHAWRMPTHVYHTLLAFFVLFSSNWAMTGISADAANNLCLDAILAMVPQHLLGFLGLKQGVWLIPFVYATIKSKCFSSTGRRCMKHGHSCVRKVISFATWPKKTCWRMVSRGLQIALQKSCSSWQVWRMKDAPHVLRQKVKGLVAPQNPLICCRCGTAKPKLVATVHDAGQFFECVTVQDSLNSARKILQLALSVTGCSHVFVFRRKRKAGFLSPNSFPACARKFRCFSFDELFLVFAAAVAVTYVAVGSHVMQLSTLPIGGLMSMIASAMVLCLNEHKWLEQQGEWAKHGFFHNVKWDQQVASLRYVDDLIQISSFFCVDCLNILPSLVYNVPFDLSQQGVQVDWLDLQVSLDPFALSMISKPMNIKPPWAVQPGYLRAWLAGRFARWGQVGLSYTQKAEEIIKIFWSLVELGYKIPTLRCLVYSFKSERWCEEQQILATCLHNAKLMRR